MKRKWIRRSLIVAGSFVFLVLLLMALIQSAAVQHEILKKVNTVLSEEFRTKVSIGRFIWRFPKTVILRDVYIEDQQGDTLFFIGETKAGLRLFDGERHQVLFNRVELDKVVVNFHQYSGREEANYEFFINYFDAGPRDTTKAPVIWTIYFDKLRLHNGSFAYKVDDDTVTGRRFNESDFRFNDINGELEGFSIVDDSLSFQIKHLALKEKNSFTVKDAESRVKIHAHGMEFDRLKLETEYSLVREYLSFSYDNWRSFNDFNNQVLLQGRLKNARVSFKDIAYFSDALKDWDQMIQGNGEAEGVLSYLKGRNMDIRYGKNTQFKGSFTLRGLPDVDNTLMDIRCDHFVTNSQELAGMIRMDKFPEPIERLGRLQYKGVFTGLYYDFVTFGLFTTDLGQIKSDLNMKLSGKEEYSGTWEFIDFNLGKCLNQPDLGLIRGSGKIQGQGFEQENMSARFEAAFERLDFMEYPYRQLTVRGKWEEQEFEGDFNADDPHLKMNFSGKIGFSEEEPVYDFVTQVFYADLGKLGIDPENPTRLAGKGKIDFTGNSLDEMQGVISLGQLSIARNDQLYRMDSLYVESYRVNGQRTLLVKSDALDGTLKGQFELSKLDKTLTNFAARLLPNTLRLKEVPLNNQHFTFDISFKRTRELIELFSSETWLDAGELNGRYNSDSRELEAGFNARKLHYKDFEFQEVRFSAAALPGADEIDLSLGFERLLKTDSTFLNTFNLNLTAGKDQVDYNLDLTSEQSRTQLDFNGTLLFDDTSVIASFSPSGITLDTNRWNIQPGSRIRLTRWEYLAFDSLELRLNDRFVRATGTVNTPGQNRLKLDFGNFDLAVINPFLFPTEENALAGTANGSFDLYDFSGKIPLFTSDFRISNLGLNSDTLGDLYLNAKAQPAYNLITVNGRLYEGTFKNLELSGFVKTEGAGSLNLKARMESTDAKAFQPLLAGMVSELKGTVGGDINITGRIDEPEVKGRVSFRDAGFKVDYLNTSYRFSQDVEINSKRFNFGRFTLTDERDKKCQVSGYIAHQFFSDFRLNLELTELNDFLCLNTKESDNSYYYGTALMTGQARFSGTFDNLRIDVKGRTEKGSNLNVPLENYGESSELNFIRFVSLDDYEQYEPYKDLSGIELNFDLEITPNAEIQLIFDSKLGDIIRAKGRSQLKMQINSNGDFKMFGDYEVAEGDYLFTAISLINKKFIIDPGGTISWNGDPMKAILNLTAHYNTRASTENLVAGLVNNTDLAAFRQKTDVQAIMKLRGELTEPEIRFGIAVPDINSLGSGVNTSPLINVLRRIESDQEEMTRQVFSLLVANMFIRPAISQQYAGGFDGDVQSGLLSSSVGDLLSNQVSNWLGQINSGWNLGINYVFGDSRANQSDLIISASQRFLNDRLEIQGTFGTNSTVRNVSATYSITPDGRVRIRAFNRTGVLQTFDNATQVQSRDRNINTQGVGLFYRIEFDLLSPERKAVRREMEALRKKNGPL